jgi:membrane protease YdiL (CAAX protease family)
VTTLVLVVAATTVAVDVLTAWADVSLGHLGRVPVSPAVPLGVVLAGLIGLRRVGLDDANLRAWREFLLVSGFVLLFGVWRYAVSIHGSHEALGLVTAALGEELVYRLAVLVVVGAASAKLLGRNWRNAEDWGVVPGVVALLVAGLVFMFLPGHVAQMSDALHAIPFACLGVVLGYAVLRTGALLPAAFVHSLLNLATIAAMSGTIAPPLRTMLAASALLALVVGTTVAGVRLGILRRIVLDPARVRAPAPRSAR